MRFAQPQHLYLLLLLLPMIGGWSWYVWWRRRQRRAIGDGALVDRMTADHSHRRRWVRAVLVIAAVGLACIAAAQPQWGRQDTTVEKTGVDVVFALDLSKSMLARDVPPDRLRAVTSEIGTVLDRLDGDRAGVVVFTSVSFVQSPLTTDYGAIRFYLNKLEPSRMSVGGTAIGRALGDAIELLTGEPLDGDGDATRSFDRADTQVIVLVTDGGDHDSNPGAMARRAADRGIDIVTVGIGGREPTRIPVLGDDGRVDGYKRDDDGDPVKTSLKTDRLRALASKGGGRYFEYRGPNSIGTRLSDYLARLEQSQLEDVLAEQHIDRYHWFLLPALLALLAALGLGERRAPFGWGADDSQTGTQRGWFAGLLGLVSIVGLVPCGCADAGDSEAADLRRSAQLLERTETEQAKQVLEEAGGDTESAALAYNRGLAALQADADAEAVEQFASALGARRPADRFDAQYNLGIGLARKGDWRKAFDAFRQALRLAVDHPDAIGRTAREHARHNLEVAYVEFHPPCEELEDDREENDTADTATALGKRSSLEDLTLCGLDADWYRLEVPAGSTVGAEATFQRLRDHPDPGSTFMPDPSRLEVALLRDGGEEELAVSETSGATSGGADPPAHRRTGEVAIAGPAQRGETAVWVRVTGTDAHEFAYDLSVEVDPPCRAQEDALEPNDSRDRAADLEQTRTRLHLCEGDEDWFEMTAEMGDDVFIDLRPAKGGRRADPLDISEVELSLIDAETGESVGRVARSDGGLTASLRSNQSRRDLFVEVSGSDAAEGSYVLRPYRFAPCPAGDDRHEENDDFSARTELPAKPRTHRFLRLCPDDADVYALSPAKQRSPGPGAGKRAATTTRIALSRHTRIGAESEQTDPSTPPETEMAVLDADGSIEQRADPPSSGADGRPRADLVTAVEPPDEGRIPIRVEGDPGYYHLSARPDQTSKRRRSKGSSKQPQSSERRSKSKPSDSAGEENRRSDRRRRRESGEESGREESTPRPPERAESKRPRDDERTEQLLRALQNDENFQMKKALEGKSDSSVGRDW